MSSRCPFCFVSGAGITAENEFAIAVRDSYPLADGHVLVIPRQHVGSIFDLTTADQQAIWSLVARVRALLTKELGVAAFNIGNNDGEAAGQTIGHTHIHVIPRRPGDIPDPRGGVRWIIPWKAKYWTD
jgi:diadenosine tetraphosphate (Ap4A) HIT family hydrolase